MIRATRLSKGCERWPVWGASRRPFAPLASACVDVPPSDRLAGDPLSVPRGPRSFVRSFDEPDEVVDLETVRSEQVSIAGITVSRDTQYPGWRWSKDVRPLVGTEWCEVRHVGYVVSGMQAVLLRDGTEFVMGPGDVMDLPAGHDAWVVGDEPVVTIGWTGVKTWLGPLDSFSERVLATLVFTDIVDSTSLAEAVGDDRWAMMIRDHEEVIEAVTAENGGTVVKFLGDGSMLAFDSARAALRSAIQIQRATVDLPFSVRIGVHTGEVRRTADDLFGLTVNKAARIAAATAAGGVTISSTTKDLVGSIDGVSMGDIRTVALKGMADTHQIVSVDWS